MTTIADYTRCNLAMRIVLMIQTHIRSDRIISDYAEMIEERFGVSKATSFRHARMALDALCVNPAKTYKRSSRTSREPHKAAPHSVGMLTSFGACA